MLGHIRYNMFFILASLLFSCSNEFESDNVENIDDKDNNLAEQIIFTAEVSDGVSSRAYWEEQTDGSLWFNWQESSEEMKFLVYDSSNGAFKTFGSSSSVYSKMKVIPTEKRNVATLESLSEIDGGYSESDMIFAYSPVGNISYENGKASIEMNLPSEVQQTEENSTKHLSPYLFISGSGTVSGEEARLSFNIMPVIIRLKVTNRTSSDINVTSVAIEGKFCTQAKIDIESGQETIAYTGSDIDNKITVQSSLGSIESDGSTSNLYCLLFPVTLEKSDNLTFYIKGDNGLDYKKTVECSRLIPSGEELLSFKANHYYTFNVNVTPNGMEILQVTVDDFVPGVGGSVTSSNSSWFVTPDGNNFGTSWSQAGNLKSIVGKAKDGDVIYVKSGDYTIDSQISINKNLTIIGGYDGSEQMFDNPDPVTNAVNFIGGDNTRCFNINNTSENVGTIKISGINFKNFNLTTANSGGVINVGSSTSDIFFEDLTFTDCSVFRDESNIKDGSNGGAIYINAYDGDTKFIVSRCQFIRCIAKEGGAIYLNNSNVSQGKSLNISECSFNGNRSDISGGAIHLRVGNNVNISKSVFSGNVASTIDNTGNGGCVHMHFNNKLTVTECTMFENIASAKGSAIYGNGNAEATQNLITINNSIIVANNASRSDNGRWALEADNIGVNNIYVIHNSIVANNTNAKNKVADLAVLNASESNIITNSIVNNKYLENGFATDAPSSGTYVAYLDETQVDELKSKVGISETEIKTYVKEQ